MNPDSGYYACIMAGGSGERFWPMSRSRTPKHLLKLLSDRTLVEETVRRVGSVVPAANIFVLTNEVQLPGTRAALAGVIAPEQIIAEPAKRDTAPAAALATAIVRARGGDTATLALLPADAHIPDAAIFQAQLEVALKNARPRNSLITFGIKPDHAATGFGYLELAPGAGEDLGGSTLRPVVRFVEKPNLETAEKYVAGGNHVWNAGMFVWSVSAFLAEAQANAPELAAFIRDFPKSDFLPFLADRFPKLPKISVDYAIMEKARVVETVLAKFGWDDVGLWTALPKHLKNDPAGNATRGPVVLSQAANNIVVSNGRTIALCGVKDLVIVETPDAVLVCHRDAVQDIKKIVQQLPKELL